MRHRKAGLKLNRTASHRKAMFRNMVTSLFKYKRIQTTDPKAKELRRWADHLITLAKRGDLHARRQALSIIREKNIVHALFEEVEEKFSGTSGGYTRVVKLGRRPGDAAPMSSIELVMSEKSKKKKKKKGKTTPAKKSTPKAAQVEDKKESAKAAQVEDKKESAKAAVDEKPEADAAVDAKAEEKSVDAETADSGKSMVEKAEDSSGEEDASPKTKPAE